MASYADLVRGSAQGSGPAQTNGAQAGGGNSQPGQGNPNGSESSDRGNSVTQTIEAVFEGQAQSPSTLHPTKAQAGEQLPPGYSRSYAGLLIKDLKHKITVNQDAVKHEMEFLEAYAVIAFFIGGKPPEHLMYEWLEKLKEQVQGPLARGRNLGRGFFILKAGDVVKNLLLLTPYRSKFGLCVFQRWIPDFDPNNDFEGLTKGSKGEYHGLKILEWTKITMESRTHAFVWGFPPAEDGSTPCK